MAGPFSGPQCQLSVGPTCCYFKSECDKMMDWDGRAILKGPVLRLGTVWAQRRVTLFMRGKSFVHLCKIATEEELAGKVTWGEVANWEPS